MALSWPHLELILAMSWPQLGPILGLLAPSWPQFGPILGLLPFSWPQLDCMPEGIYFPWALVARNMVPRHPPGRPPAGILWFVSFLNLILYFWPSKWHPCEACGAYVWAHVGLETIRSRCTIAFGSSKARYRCEHDSEPYSAPNSGTFGVPKGSRWRLLGP